jgi:phage portal protein BeeE
MSETKSSRTGPLTALAGAGRAVWTPKNHAALAREGFAGNAIGYRCLRMLAEAAASVPLVLYDGASELHEHPLLRLLARPNPAESGRGLMERFHGQLLLSGNAYLEAVKLGEEVRELHALRPDRMRLIAGRSGWPEAYDYMVNGQAIRFQQEGAVPPILHLKLLHPADDHFTACRRSKRRHGRSTSTMQPAPGARRCSTMRRGRRGRWSTRPATAISPTINSSSSSRIRAPPMPGGR